MENIQMIDSNDTNDSALIEELKLFIEQYQKNPSLYDANQIFNKAFYVLTQDDKPGLNDNFLEELRKDINYITRSELFFNASDEIYQRTRNLSSTIKAIWTIG